MSDNRPTIFSRGHCCHNLQEKKEEEKGEEVWEREWLRKKTERARGLQAVVGLGVSRG